MAESNAEKRIRNLFGQLYLTEPVYQALALKHKLVEDKTITTIGIGKREIHFNPEFIDNLTDNEFKDAIFTELDRALLKHPYERKRKNATSAWYASTMTIREATNHSQWFMSAEELVEKIKERGYTEDQQKFFELYKKLSEMPDEELERKTGWTKEKLYAQRERMEIPSVDKVSKRHMEYYYNIFDKFAEANDALIESGEGNGSGNGENNPSGSSSGNEEEGGNGRGSGSGDEERNKQKRKKLMPSDPSSLAKDWGEDELIISEINDVISEAEATGRWGSIGGNFREAVLASRIPKVDYKALLRHLKMRILSSNTTINRMRPNRRFGFGFPGKKREYTTSISVYIDTSASVGSKSLARALGTINGIFKCGCKDIDVWFFDTKIQMEKPLKIEKAIKKCEFKGRCGTNFQAVFDHIEALHKKPDGVIIYTDMECSVPDTKGYSKKDVIFLADTEKHYEDAKNEFGEFKLAFVRGEDEV